MTKLTRLLTHWRCLIKPLRTPKLSYSIFKSSPFPFQLFQFRCSSLWSTTNSPLVISNQPFIYFNNAIQLYYPRHYSCPILQVASFRLFNLISAHPLSLWSIFTNLLHICTINPRTSHFCPILMFSLICSTSVSHVPPSCKYPQIYPTFCLSCPSFLNLMSTLSHFSLTCLPFISGLAVSHSSRTSTFLPVISALPFPLLCPFPLTHLCSISLFSFFFTYNTLV